MNRDTEKDGLYIALISVHGLIRAQDLELGRDSDTGGQTLYVVQLASALGQRPEVDQVDLYLIETILVIKHIGIIADSLWTS